MKKKKADGHAGNGNFKFKLKRQRPNIQNIFRNKSKGEMYMIYIPEDGLAKIKENMKMPMGTFEFSARLFESVDFNVPGLIIPEIIAGEQIFLLEIDEKLSINFYHSSPGTGTRMASIDSLKFKDCNVICFALQWAPEEISLCMGEPGKEGIISRGCTAPIKLRSAKGQLIRIGDEGVKVMGIKMTSNGETILASTAIEMWDQTIEAINILKSGKSDVGFMYEVVQTNFILSSLVTGFEVYSKKRFIELEQEGIAPDLDNLVNSVFKAFEKEKDLPSLYMSEAQSEGISLLQNIVRNKKINFQNYDSCKIAYLKTYGLKFTELRDFGSEQTRQLKKYILYRHKIIHVEPLIATLDHDNGQPVFSNQQLADEAIGLFNIFVHSLHEATLKLQ